MKNEKFGSDRYSVRPARPDAEPVVSEEGVVSGEIGRVETPEAEDAGLERMRLIETEARKDAQLAEVFAAYADEAPSVRAGNIMDRINAMRRELEASDSDPAFKRARGNWLSGIANRLRELL